MLKLYNKEHEAISALTNLKDYKIEYLLSGEDLLEFSLSICDENIHLVEEEGYVRTKNNEYVIKAMDPSQSYKRFSCIVNIESIKGKSISNFDTSNNNITDTIRLAIAGTGWILVDNNMTKRRTVRLKNTNALEVLREIRKVFRVDFRFDAINKKIYVYEQFGEDRGVYFTDELNLVDLKIPSDTYDYATRLIAIGKNGLDISSVNDGKKYLENFQYSNKVIEVIWEDGRYTDVNSLKEDAKAKLEELAKPKRSYQASVSDLAKQSEEYKFLDFFLGDTITLLSKQEKFRDKQRIVKYIEYPNNPTQNTCELGNTTLTFEELQKENEHKNQVVNNITSDNGTVDGSKVDSITTEQISDFKASVAEITDLTAINIKVSNLEAQNVTITGELNTVRANVGTLTANVGVIDKLTVTHTAQINSLEANKASITQLEAVSATIGTLEVEVGKIETLVNGNLSSENIQVGGITGNSLNMDTIFVKDANMINVNISALKAGDISTNKFRIISDDGGIEIVGATQQWKDKNNKVRMQAGKDAQGNFTFGIFDETGQGLLIDHTGVKEKALGNNIIKEHMIAGDSIGEKQINYSSFVSGFNKDTNTSTIKSSKVNIDLLNQTLDIAFNSLKTQSDDTKSLTESHSTTIGVMQGQITTAINNTQIVKDGQTILLKDDYNRTVATVDSMKSTIGSHSTTIDQHTGKITGVETKTNELERTINSFSSRLSSTETTVTTHTTNITKAQTDATKGINDAKVAKTQADKGVNDAKGALDKANAVDGRVTTLSTTVTSTSSKVSAIEQNMESITQRVSSTETKVTTVTTTANNALTNANKAILNTDNIWTKDYNVNTATPLQLKDFDGTSNFNPKYWYEVDGFIDSTGTDNGAIVIFKGDGSKFTIEKVKEKGTSSNHIDFFLNNGIPSVRLYGHASFYTVRVHSKKVPRNISLTTEISTTKSKVSTIETNLSSITSRVSTVEQTQTSINGKVTALETWKKQAEVKITDASIISTVSSQFYKKTETDSKYASQTQISQLSNQINLKVDANGVNSIIQQNPNSVKIGFNGIDTRTQIDSNGISLFNTNSIKTTMLKQGNIYQYNGSTGVFLGGYLSSRTSSSNNLAVVGGYHTKQWIVSRSSVWQDDTNNNPTNVTDYFFINFVDVGNNKTGIHLASSTYVHAAINMQNNDLLNANIINANTSKHRTWRDTLNNIAMDCNPDGKIYLGKHINTNGYSVANSSDRNLKQDIEYVDNSKIRTINLKEQLYNEFKNKFKFATFRYKNEDLNSRERFGFIAQDLLNTVFEDYVLVNKDSACENGDYLSYDLADTINVVAGILQEEIRVRDKQIEELRDEIENIKLTGVA